MEENHTLSPYGFCHSPIPESVQSAVQFEAHTCCEEETSQGPAHAQPLGCKLLVELFDGVQSPNKRSASSTPRLGHTYFDWHPMFTDAWDCLRRSVVYFKGNVVGTIAAVDQASDALNYDQVFIRDFVPSGLAFLMNDEPDIVKNFLLRTLHLQSSEKRVDCFTQGQVMSASFKVLHNHARRCDTVIADFGETTIGRVAPVDSGFWCIILLRAYTTKPTGDYSLSQMPECQTGMKLILSLFLSEGFDIFPTLLCADGCCMIDRIMVC